MSKRKEDGPFRGESVLGLGRGAEMGPEAEACCLPLDGALVDCPGVYRKCLHGHRLPRQKHSPLGLELGRQHSFPSACLSLMSTAPLSTVSLLAVPVSHL